MEFFKDNQPQKYYTTIRYCHYIQTRELGLEQIPVLVHYTATNLKPKMRLAGPLAYASLSNQFILEHSSLYQSSPELRTRTRLFLDSTPSHSFPFGPLSLLRHMVAHICNSSTREAEAGESQVQG
jgi:hypothetical protein